MAEERNSSSRSEGAVGFRGFRERKKQEIVEWRQMYRARRFDREREHGGTQGGITARADGSSSPIVRARSPDRPTLDPCG